MQLNVKKGLCFKRGCIKLHLTKVSYFFCLRASPLGVRRYLANPGPRASPCSTPLPPFLCSQSLTHGGSWTALLPVLMVHCCTCAAALHRTLFYSVQRRGR